MRGFDVPECALWHPETGCLYVSNIEAPPDEYWSDNGKGFISRLHPDGTVEIDTSGKQPPQPFGLADHFTNLDGIEVLEDGTFIVSDFVGDKVCLISPDRKTVTTHWQNSRHRQNSASTAIRVAYLCRHLRKIRSPFLINRNNVAPYEI